VLQSLNGETQLPPALARRYAPRLVPLPHHSKAGHDVGPLFNGGLHGLELVMGGDKVAQGFQYEGETVVAISLGESPSMVTALPIACCQALCGLLLADSNTNQDSGASCYAQSTWKRQPATSPMSLRWLAGAIEATRP
jgi:hypothetical protein